MYRVTADICFEVEDDQAQNEEQAKLAAIEQLGDFFLKHSWFDLLQVEKVEKIKGGNMKVGETYTGDELCELCGADLDDCSRDVAVIGSKAAVIATDVGNDNYEITHIVKEE